MSRLRVRTAATSLVVSALALAGCQGVTSSGGGAGGAPGAGGATGAGGSTGTGGTTGAGGAAGAGGGTAMDGGADAGTGGATGSGCGATSWPAGDQMYTLDVAGTSRQYIIGLPTGYDGSKPERLVFAFHGRTGTAMQIAGTGTRGYYGLRTMMPDTIFVAPQGLDTDPTDTNTTDWGWPNTNGQDIAFVRAMIASLSASYCIDQGRIFSTGFSYGGIMSHTIGCQMSDVFRAIAPMAGAIFGRANCNAHPIAAWMTHGTMDTSAAGGVDYSAGQTARDRIVTLDHCQATTTAVGPDPMCVSYDGCDAGYPVHWCPHTGAHVIPSFAAQGIADFFKQF